MIFRSGARSTWVVLTLLLLGQGAAVAWTSRPGWLGWMPAGAAAYEQTSLFGAAILGAAVAWAGVSLRAHRADAWARVGLRTVHELYRAPFLWGMSAYATASCALAVLIGVATRQSASPEILLRYLLSVVAVLAAAACAAGLGTLLARFAPSYVAVVVAFLVPYAIAVGLGGYLWENPISAWAVPATHAAEYSWPALATPVFRAVSLGCIAGAIFLELHRRSGLRRVAMWAASAATAGVLLTAGPVQSISDAVEVRCVGAAPVICFDGTQDAVRADYRAQLEAGLGELPEDLHPDVVAATEQPGPPEGAVVLPPVTGKYQPAHTVPAGAVTAILGDVTFATECSSPDRAQLSAAMTLWWRDHLGLPRNGGTYVGQDPLSAPELAEAQEASRRLDALVEKNEQVVTEAYAQLRDCSLPARPLP